MIEKVVYDYLKSNLTVPVYMEYPANAPKTFVLLEKTGTGIDNHIKSATFAVQSYDTTLFKTAELNERIKEVMLGIIALDDVSRCELNSDYNYTDTDNKKYRYQAVFDLVHY